MNEPWSIKNLGMNSTHTPVSPSLPLDAGTSPSWLPWDALNQCNVSETSIARKRKHDDSVQDDAPIGPLFNIQVMQPMLYI